jgi:hypothetical protein
MLPGLYAGGRCLADSSWAQRIIRSLRRTSGSSCPPGMLYASWRNSVANPYRSRTRDASFMTISHVCGVCNVELPRPQAPEASSRQTTTATRLRARHTPSPPDAKPNFHNSGCKYPRRRQAPSTKRVDVTAPRRNLATHAECLEKPRFKSRTSGHTAAWSRARFLVF